MGDTWVAAFAWLSFYLWVQLAAWAALPLASRVFRALPDGGYAYAKLLGPLLLGYAAWVLGMLGFLQHSRPGLVVLLVLVAVVCWAAWGRALLAALPSRPVLAATEGLFLAAMVILAVIRAYNADINGQEKFMDYALMNAFSTSIRLPAEDPWMSGYGVPYYYFGYLLQATLGELAGIPAAIGYNLALVLVLALTLLLSASLVFNALSLMYSWTSTGTGSSVGSTGRSSVREGRPSRRASAASTRRSVVSASRLPIAPFVWALLAAFVVGVVGNLQAPLQILALQGAGGNELWKWLGVKELQTATSPQPWPAGFNWFMASRVIPNIPPDGIAEFPYFSFLLGDLHPHFQTLPVNLTVLGLGLALVLVGQRGFGWAGVAVSALVLGSLIAANTWDVPTFWLAFAAASLYADYRFREPGPGRWIRIRRAALPFGVGIILFLPYFVSYVSQPLGLGLVRERTHLGSLMVVIGPFLVLALLYGIRGLVTGQTRAALGALQARFGARSRILLIGVPLAALLLETATGEWTLLALTLPLALAFPLGATYFPVGFQKPLSTGDDSEVPAPAVASVGGLLVWFLTTFGLLVLLGTELIYIHDSFGTRMNTVFKFHYHAWLLLGLASALVLAMLFHETRTRVVGRTVAASLAAVLLLVGAAYPVTATLVKSNHFRVQPTLDGSRFLAQSKAGDFRAIEWLRGQSAERPVVLEAVGGDYQEFGRVSTFSGLPTVMGWVGHELQWRGGTPELTNRPRDVELIYRDGDEPTIRRLLDRYRVRYVFVGSLEMERYGPGVDARFARLLEPVFQTQGAVVYRVPTGIAQAGRPG